QGEVILEGSVATTESALRSWVEEMGPCVVAMEVGTHSPWVSRLLKESGQQVIVANARRVRLIIESSRKNDRLDARTLARLARMDVALLAPIRHRSAQAQEHLIMIRRERRWWRRDQAGQRGARHGKGHRQAAQEMFGAKHGPRRRTANRRRVGAGDQTPV